MTTTRMSYLMIVASVRDGRVGPSIARWYLDELADDPSFHEAIDVLDLADVDRGALEAGRVDDALRERLSAADGFVIVTPEYNHSYPGPLKSFLDAFRTEWMHKPVTFVSYGGASGGLRSVEHLRAVIAELYMVGTRNGVAIHAPWEHLADGTLTLDAATRAAARLGMDELRWWAETLQPARGRVPEGV